MERPFCIIYAFSIIFKINLEFKPAYHIFIDLNPQVLILDYIFSRRSQKLSLRRKSHTKKNISFFKKGVLNSIYIMMSSESSFVTNHRI